MALSPGTQLGAYEIKSAIGAGGMGEVYRATDTKLGREVAVKILPAEMAQDPDRLARFHREARAVAALNHPNVVTLYSVEECGGLHFLTMELVEGLSLDRRIASGGLPVDQIISIAGALSEALAAAHEKGIVHRDLKPANVMITNEGRVKVLDFGLAKDVGAAVSDGATMTSDGRTQAGIVMGTPAYMSPEQVSGRTLDHRTDIFSLGIVLHEMATGKRPFEGSSSAELVSAILRDTPPLVTDMRTDLPSDLARVIRRCLEKDPRHRVQTARDVSNEFRDLAHSTSRQTVAAVSASRGVAAADSGAARTDEGFWVAVLPFKYAGRNADLTALSDGLTEDIIAGMSRFSYLRVIARSSTARYSQQGADLRGAARELGARYVMEGSLRQAGTKIRIAVQLVDASSGVSLWTETYDRPFTPDSTLDLLDDVVPRIVATVGDAQGVLAHSMTEALRNRDPESLTPYEALLRSFGFHQHVSADEHLAGRTALEHAVKEAPDRADCWAMLSWLYRAEYSHGYNPRPDPMDRSLAAARRAVNLAPSSQLAQAALASAFFFRREIGSFRNAAERALALNRMQGYTTAFLGYHYAFSGDWERGCALAEQATQLNPNHPGWYWLPLALNAYRQNDGQRALEYVLKINMPGLWTAQLALAVIEIQLGQIDAARAVFKGVLALRPALTDNAAEEFGKWWPADLSAQMLGDLRKAGFATGSGEAKLVAVTSAARSVSGSSFVDEGFRVAVLPFKYKGAEAGLEALSEGITEEIITGLSRFSYLRVIANTASSRYANAAVDAGSAAKELGARYVMEGSIRQAGSKLRIAVQLVDALSGGAHLWAETYERTFTAESIFELQDDLVPCIVSTVADMSGVLLRSMSDAVRGKPVEQLTAYEAVLRGCGYLGRITPEEHAAARMALERAVQLAPDNALAWAVLSLVWGDEHAQGFGGEPDPLGRALKAARKAVDLDPSNHWSLQALASVHFHRREISAFRSAADRAIALNPMDAGMLANMGGLMASSGDWERGCAVVQRAMRLNPKHPGWYWFPLFHNAYRKRDYPGALNIALKVNLPGYYFTHVALAVSYAQLGQQEAAANALRELLTLVPSFAAVARQWVSVWLPEADTVEHVMEGLRKAGLEIAAAATPALHASQPIAKSESGAARAAAREDEGFWVAVLPFKGVSGDADLEALADGLTEDVTTGLARFPYLQVIAHNSAMAYKGRAADMRTVGRELGARYLLEGSIRKRGAAIRVNAQLMDAASGTQLWAESYDREINSANAFQVQDDLTDHIVTCVADGHGVLVRSMAAPTRDRKVEELSASELVLRYYAFMQQVDLQEHAALRDGFERALEREPNHAVAWACLSNLYVLEYGDGFNPRENPIERAREAAWRSVKIDPACQMGWKLLSVVYFFTRDFVLFRETAEKALTLNPRDGTTLAYVGILMAYSGDWERGVAMVQRAMDLNRHHPGWYYNASWAHHYRKGEYEAALLAAKKINMPEYHWTHLATAAAYGMLGRQEEARASIESLRKCAPMFLDLENVREEIARWDPDNAEVERLVQGLLKAGLKYGPGAARTEVEPTRLQ